MICATRNIQTKSKIIKQKNVKNGIIQLLEEDGCLVLIFFENKIIKKSKIFIKSSKNNLNKKIALNAKREFKKWEEIIWKEGYIEEDDSQILDKLFNL